MKRVYLLVALALASSVALAGCVQESDAPPPQVEAVQPQRFEENPDFAAHEAPADEDEAREALEAACVDLADLWADEATITALVPACTVTGDLASATSVFDVTSDEGGSYLVAFCDGDDPLGMVDWGYGVPGFGSTAWRSFFDGFYYPVSEAEQMLENEFGQKPEAIRYVRAYYGYWVVARVGDVEQGVFLADQGIWECWPSSTEVYVGDRILDHLMHVATYHSDDRQECDPDW